MRRTSPRNAEDCNGSAHLLDTNICIYIWQTRPAEVLRRFRKLRPGEAALSIITSGELLYGAFESEHRVLALAGLRELMQLLPALALPETAAEAHGAIRAGLEGKGEMIGKQRSLDCCACPGGGVTLVANNWAA